MSVWHGGVVFDEIASCFDVDDGGGGVDLEGDVEGDGDEGADVYVVRVDGESCGCYFEVVGIEREVGELVVAGGVDFGVAAVAADGIFDGDGGAGDDCAGGVGDGAVDGCRSCRLIERMRRTRSTKGPRE